jgi:hypothetical protein
MENHLEKINTLHADEIIAVQHIDSFIPWLAVFGRPNGTTMK